MHAGRYELPHTYLIAGRERAYCLFMMNTSIAKPSTIDTTALIAELRGNGRTELIHYAGAAHRDIVAWWMCAHYLADKAIDEAALKSRALKDAHGWDVSPEQLRTVRK